jgi:hypothetical protein
METITSKEDDMETLFIILISVLSLITLIASFLLFSGLFPEKVQKIQATLTNNWKRSFWIGLSNTILITIFVFGLGSLGGSYGLFYIPAFGIYGAYLIGLLFGLTAFVGYLRGRLFPNISPVKGDIRAGAVVLLSSLLPFIGWFLLFPYLISLSVGSVIITIFQRNKATELEE